MACPHVSGVIALMLQKVPTATFKQIFNRITSKAVTKSLDTESENTCDLKSQKSFPNNVFGYGRIDAVNSVNVPVSLT